MKVNRFIVEGKFGVELSCFSIIPEEVKGTIVIFHGMGEHKERYLHFAKWMSKQGYAVFAHDHRKHGKSISEFDKVGIFSGADRWEYVIDDCHYVVKEAKHQVPDSKIIILGHSMGSIIARRYISKYTAHPSAAIIMGTLPIHNFRTTFAPLLMARIVKLFKRDNPAHFLADTLNKQMMASYENPRTQYEWLTNDEKEVDKYIEDELCGYAYNANFYIEFFKGVREVNKTVAISETRDIPILFISGKDDPVGNFGDGVKDVQQMYNGHGFFQLTIKLIENNRHEVLNEVNKLNTYKYILEWCDSCLEK